MEIFLSIVVILLLWNIRNILANKNENLILELRKLTSELNQLKNQFTGFQKPPIITPEAKKESIPETSIPAVVIIPEVKLDSGKPEPVVLKESFTPPKPMHVVAIQTNEDTITPAPVEKIVAQPKEEVKQVTPSFVETKVEIPTKPLPKNEPVEKSFMEKYPDLEKFIGENLVNKIGIAILVLGIGYFVKYAIDKNWINEIGRVAIGVLCGGILIGLAHRLRKEFIAFSSVLVGGGIAVLYFTISLAFHDYHLFSQTVAFAMMVAITAFAVVLSITYDRVELAVLAIIGGFGSPFFVSTGQGNYVVLFSYLLILNLGMLSLANHKKWNIVNILCYVFTIFIYGGWIITKFHPDSNDNALAVLLFGLAFYIVFFAMNIVHNLKNKLPFQALDLSLLLSNTLLFYSAGLYLLNVKHLEDYKGLFTILMGLFNLGFAYPLYKRGNVDKNLIFMLIGLVLTFISLAAPIQLNGHNITLFWGAETVLLLWLSQKSGIKLIKQTSILITVLLLISLVMDWSNNYSFNSTYLLPFANKAFITGIFTVAALFVTLRLLKNETLTSFNVNFIELKDYRQIIKVIAVCVLYIVSLFEVIHQSQYYYDNVDVRNISVTAYHFSYVLILIYFYEKQNSVQFTKVKLALLCISILMLFISNINSIEIRYDILIYKSPLQIFYYLHFYFILIGFYFIYMLHKSLVKLAANTADEFNYVYWLTIILFVYTASMELDHLFVYTMFDKQNKIQFLLTQSHKFGYAILWGTFAFALINMGMKRKIRELRIISLVLFSIVVIKLFVYDINNISEAGKIVAFILLGVLLLVVSFMYQRLKKLIAADNNFIKTDRNNEEV